MTPVLKRLGGSLTLVLLDWLLERLKELKQRKSFSYFAPTPAPRLILGDAMRIRSGIAATTFHEGMSIIERDRAAAWFADDEFGAQVMFCSEIGSERPKLPV